MPWCAGGRTENLNLGVPVISGTHPGPRLLRCLLNCHGTASRQSVDRDQVVARRANPIPLDGGNTRAKMHHHLLEHPLSWTSGLWSGLGEILDDERQLSATHEFTNDEVA